MYFMNIAPTSSTFYYKADHNDATTVIKTLNNELLKIEKELYNQYEPSPERKNELNSKAFENINIIEDILKNKEEINITSIKRLQELNVMYGMAAMKSGDTEWESFGLSKEVFENNEKFFNSTDCLLSTSEQLKQKIDIEKRLTYWNTCQYNFAYNIVYEGMSAPSDLTQNDFHHHFEQCSRSNISNDIAIAAANAKCAENLCKSSLTEQQKSSDILMNTTLRLNKFYHDYINTPSAYLNDDIRSDAFFLVKNLSVYLPFEIKEKFGIN